MTRPKRCHECNATSYEGHMSGCMTARAAELDDACREARAFLEGLSKGGLDVSYMVDKLNEALDEKAPEPPRMCPKGHCQLWLGDRWEECRRCAREARASEIRSNTKEEKSE